MTANIRCPISLRPQELSDLEGTRGLSFQHSKTTFNAKATSSIFDAHLRTALRRNQFRFPSATATFETSPYACQARFVPLLSSKYYICSRGICTAPHLTGFERKSHRGPLQKPLCFPILAPQGQMVSESWSARAVAPSIADLQDLTCCCLWNQKTSKHYCAVKPHGPTAYLSE